MLGFGNKYGMKMPVCSKDKKRCSLEKIFRIEEREYCAVGEK